MWSVLVICATVGVSISAEGTQDAPAGQPNIVFVLADDYGFRDIGYHGSEIKTPTFDALAASGVKLENYYVQPVCSPTRSQLLSGRYQIHTGLQHGIILAYQANALPTDSPTLADKLKESGYATHAVGKWHLGFYKEEYLPWKRGFDTFFGLLTGRSDHFNHTNGYNGTQYLDLRDARGPVRNETGNYSTHLFTGKAIDVVKSHNTSKPLFLYLAYQSVHNPLQVPAKYENLYKNITNQNRRIYAGMVSAMDEGVANLTQALKDTGLWNNTIFIFSTDNGGTVVYGGSNYPLRGWKASLWEGGVHGVGFVAGGALKRSGAVSQDLIHVSDWFPTIVRLAGGNLNGTKPLDGIDQWDTISYGAPSKRTVLLHNIDILEAKKGVRLYNDTWDTRVMAAIRVGDYKLITGDPGNGSWVPPPDGHQYTVPENKDAADKNVWLFNITADPNEHDDLSDVKPDIVLTMLDLLTQFNNTAVPPRFPPLDPQSDPGLRDGVWGPWQ